MAATGDLGALCERHGVELLVVHGSVLDDEPIRPPLDLDFAYRFRRGVERDVVALVSDLTEAARYGGIDPMDLHRAGPVASARALGPQSLVLYEAFGGAFAIAQMAALTMEMETRALRRLDLELMAG